MERRKFIVGMGSLAAGSAAAMGTGAFGDVDAERNLSGQIVDDSNAYLSLTSASQYSTTISKDGDANQVAVQLDRLPDDAEVSIDDAFRLTNHGNEPVYIYVDFLTNGDSNNVYFYPNGDESRSIKNGPDPTNDDASVSKLAYLLGVGDTLKIGVFFDTSPSSGGAFGNQPSMEVHATDTASEVPIPTP